MLPLQGTFFFLQTLKEAFLLAVNGSIPVDFPHLRLPNATRLTGSRMINFILPLDVPENLRKVFEKAVRFRGHAWQEEILSGNAFLDLEIPDYLQWLVEYAYAQQVDSFPQYNAYSQRAFAAAVRPEHRAYIASDLLYWLRTQNISASEYPAAIEALEEELLRQVQPRVYTQLEALYYVPLLFNILGTINFADERDRARVMIDRLVAVLFTGLEMEDDAKCLDHRLQLFARILEEYGDSLAEHPEEWQFLLPHLRLTLHATVAGFTEWNAAAQSAIQVQLQQEEESKLLKLYSRLRG